MGDEAVPPVSIRRARASDVPDLMRMFSDRGAYAGTLQLPYPSESHWTERLTRAPDGTYDLAAVAHDVVVGMVSLHCNPHRPRRSHAASIGIAVADAWQGRGVGTALMAAAIDMADNWLGLVRLELEVFADNEVAMRLYRRFGFEVEGCMKAHGLRDGAFVDTIVMGRVRGR